MNQFLIAVGGTGQMVSLNYWRLCEMMPWADHDMPTIFYVDQDMLPGFTSKVDCQHLAPLPSGSPKHFGPYLMDPNAHQLCEDILGTLFSEAELDTDIERGMFARPPVGATMVMDMLNDPHNTQLTPLKEQIDGAGEGVIVVMGSAMGGTGAGGVPSVAKYLDKHLSEKNRRKHWKIYVIYFLNHFRVQGLALLRDNAESGMAYMADKIYRGTDSCILLGTDTPPPRPEQVIGHQREAANPLYLLAALDLINAFTVPDVFNHRFCGHGVELDHFQGASQSGQEGEPRSYQMVAEVREPGVPVRLPNGRAVEWEEFMTFNKAGLEMWKRLINLLWVPPGFALCSHLPRRLTGAVGRMALGMNRSRNESYTLLAKELEREMQRMQKQITWYEETLGAVTQPFKFKAYPPPDEERFLKALDKPMGFLRECCHRFQMPDPDSRDRRDQEANTLAKALVKSLFVLLDEQFYERKFGLQGG